MDNNITSQKSQKSNQGTGTRVQEKQEEIIDSLHEEKIEKGEEEEAKKQKIGPGIDDGNEQVRFEEVTLEGKEEEEEEIIEDSPEKAQTHKSNGAQFFKQGDAINAIQQYEKALRYTSDKNLRATLCSNIAICLIKEEQFGEAKKYCLKALKNDESFRKARTNYARCLEHEQKFQEALEEYKKLEIDVPQNQKAFIKEKVEKLQKKVDQINEKRKQEVIGGLKNIGNSILGYFGMSLDNFKLEQGPGGGYNVSFQQ